MSQIFFFFFKFGVKCGTLRSLIKKCFKNWKIISCLTNYGKTRQKTQIYGEKNLTATTTTRVTTHCYAGLYPTRWRLSHCLTWLYRFYPLNMFGLFLIKIFLYIVWLDLISGFDCLVGEIFFFLRLRGVETINPEHMKWYLKRILKWWPQQSG